MLFNSLSFLYGFLPVTYTVFWNLNGKTARYIWLTVTGYFFYSFWDYRFCALMAFSTVVSYTAGRCLLVWDDPLRRRLCLIVPITVDLALLGYFKYTNFALETVNGLASLFQVPVDLPLLSIVLPVGISFYTFHTISYIVDSYRRTVTPTRNFFEFSSYVSLFSQLVAGPIVRFGQIEQDLANIDKADRTRTINVGWSFFTIGMIEKVLIADTIAAVIDPALAEYQQLSTISSWLCMLGYTYQLYFDFSGYSNMAVGLGLLFGIRIPQNFNSPYKSLDISDFWRRWHMSLSNFLRDYLYIPLGGNRGSKWMVYRNLFITMLLGGLWHGANWTFVFWGSYHGLLLIAHRVWGHAWDRFPSPARQAGTFLLVLIGWVFFRSTSFDMALTVLRKMFVPASGLTPPGVAVLAVMLLIAGAVAHLAPNAFEIDHSKLRPGTVAALAGLFLLCLLVLYASRYSPFLYFQF